MSNLAKLLGYDALGVIKGLVATDVFGASGRGGRRNFANEAAGLTERTRSLHFGSGLKDGRKKVVALGKFDLRLQLRFLHTVRHFVSAHARSKARRTGIAQGAAYLWARVVGAT